MFSMCIQHSVTRFSSLLLIWLIKSKLVCFSALEPFFNAAASQFILGQSIPITLWLSLAPVVIGNFSVLCFDHLIIQISSSVKCIFLMGSSSNCVDKQTINSVTVLAYCT